LAKRCWRAASCTTAIHWRCSNEKQLSHRHCAGAARGRYPHCEAVHAKSPAIYLIRPDNPVPFQRADDDGEIDVSLIIALIVENPTAQLKLLRRLFSELQNPHTLEALLAASDEQLPELFRHSILEPEPSARLYNILIIKGVPYET
jgi:hypothetical protein